MKSIIDEHLTRAWKSVFPICPTCRADGVFPLPRKKRRNGAASGQLAQWARLASPTIILYSPVEAANGDATQHDGVPAREPDARVTVRRGRRDPLV